MYKLLRTLVNMRTDLSNSNVPGHLKSKVLSQVSKPKVYGGAEFLDRRLKIFTDEESDL